MRRNGIRVVLIGVTLAATLGGPAAHAARPSTPDTTNGPVSAAAGNGTYSIVPVRNSNSCLTGSGSGNHAVVVATCSDLKNFGQQWDLWFGGWARNVGSGECLTLKPGWVLATDRCVWGNRYQEWKFWYGGWFQNHYDGACLTWFLGTLQVQPCIDNEVQFWYEEVRWS